MRVLVTGGAGYIGSHALRLLARGGHEVWAYDNLSLGHRSAVPSGRLIEGELMDRRRIVEALSAQRIEAVMHFAAFASVGESVVDPAKYYQNNVVATLNLLEAMREAGVARIVFSSTTATYGVPRRIPIREDEPQQPINPYGFAKLVVERALADYAHAYGLAYAALRYFNAAGASPAGDLGEDHDPETHLIPIVLAVALGQRPHITIFGDDYPTRDGTCIRDYVHVDDLGAAHLLSARTPRAGARSEAESRHRPRLQRHGGDRSLPQGDRPCDSRGAGPAPRRRSAGAGGRCRPGPHDARLGARVHGHRIDRPHRLALAPVAPARLRRLSAFAAADPRCLAALPRAGRLRAQTKVFPAELLHRAAPSLR